MPTVTLGSVKLTVGDTSVTVAGPSFRTVTPSDAEAPASGVLGVETASETVRSGSMVWVDVACNPFESVTVSDIVRDAASDA